jgi:hypothetical protein
MGIRSSVIRGRGPARRTTISPNLVPPAVLPRFVRANENSPAAEKWAKVIRAANIKPE